MESRLQSNEIRIPKTIVSSGGIHPSSITSIAFARTKSDLMSGFNSFGNNPSGITMPQNQSFPDFDLNSPCQYFKSSFARSLSVNAANQTKSLDFGINFGLTSRNSPIHEEPQTPINYHDNNNGGISSYFDDVPPPLPQSQPPVMSTTNFKNPNEIINTNMGNASILSTNSSNYSGSSNSSNNNNNNNNSFNRNVWSSSHKQNPNRRSFDSTEIEVLRLRKECQNLIEENRRLMGLATGCVDGNLVVPGNSPNIEAVILQTQVDTLQWQLKQVEASREMYRAVMEEVVRFLERCHRNLDSMQNEQIARSKSVHYVYQNDVNDNTNSTITGPRARSSTNLVDTQKLNSSSISSSIKAHDESVATLPATTYNNFRDFTWRRSPKRTVSSQLATSECDPEKLSQDAFRLLRTAQNLLNTQEPDLTQPKHTIDLQYSRNPTTNSSSSSTLGQKLKTKLQTPNVHKQKSSSCQIDSESFCITFSRKMNMRESRLSLRSSTDGSVHSTSSSKNETDEENLTPPNIINHHHHNQQSASSVCPTTEDESGFSSISSFQEIGLPMHSTMISPRLNSSQSDDSGELLPTDLCLDSKNSTLKASQQSLITSAIGIPSAKTISYNHRRWDSAPAVPPRTNLHVFSAKDESQPTVLWV